MKLKIRTNPLTHQDPDASRARDRETLDPGARFGNQELR